MPQPPFKPSLLWNRLGFRVALYVVLTGLLLANLLSGIQFYREYRKEAVTIGERLILAERTQRVSLAESLWNFDRDYTRLQLESILFIPDLVYVRLETENGELFEHGVPIAPGKRLSRSVPLTRGGRILGTLEIQASLDGPRQRMISRILPMLLANCLWALAVALIFIFIFQWFLARHLRSMAHYAKGLDLDHLNTALILERRARPQPDELDEVVGAMNHMRTTLIADLANREVAALAMQKLNQELQVTNVELKRMSARAEAASLAKSQFLATVSHELRTPLNIVALHAELLQEELEEAGEGQRFIKDVQTIRMSGNRLLSIIEDILTLTDLEVESVQAPERPLELAPLAASLEAYAAEHTHVPFHVQIQPSSLPPLFADPAKVRMCLEKLLGNACKFTREGHITLEVTEETHEGLPGIAFHLRDTGPGIPQESRELIFEAFTQMDQGLTRQHEGTGLGLTVCRRLALALGGSLSLCSEVGAGSTFTLHVPLRSNG